MSREAGSAYEFGPFRLDLAEHTLLRDGHPVPLTPKVFNVLRVLVQNAGHLVEKDTLLKEVWPDSFVEEGALNRNVSILRKALGDGTSGQKYIETAPKFGYRFVASVIKRLNDGSLPIDEAESRFIVEIAPIPADSLSLPNHDLSQSARVGIAKTSGDDRGRGSDCRCSSLCGCRTRRASGGATAACAGAQTGHVHWERGGSCLRTAPLSQLGAILAGRFGS